MKHHLGVISGLLGLCGFGLAQHNIGLPTVSNFSKQTYKAGTQNWQMAQDSQGLLFVANNEGLLCYDGAFWRLHPLPNRTIVRSVGIYQNSKAYKVYAGGQNEIGYFVPNNEGGLVYESLMERLKPEDRNFDDVWQTIVFKNQVFFRVRTKILHLNGDKMSVYPTRYWNFLDTCMGRVLAQDPDNGLMVFNGSGFQPLSVIPVFSAGTQVCGVRQWQNDTMLVATQKHGLYKVIHNQVLPFVPTGMPELPNETIHCIEKLPNGLMALGTRASGIYILNAAGEVIHQYNAKTGMQNQTILSLLTDNSGNLWAGLDNGIDYIAHNEPILKIMPETSLNVSGYAAALFNNRLILGTASGIWTAQITNSLQIGLNRGPLQRMAKPDGQIWNLREINGQLMIGHHEGATLLRPDFTLRQFGFTTGYWCFEPAETVQPVQKLITGTYRGIKIVGFNQPNWDNPPQKVDFESSRFVVPYEDKIWISHPYKGIFCVNKNDTLLKVQRLDSTKGIKFLTKNYLFRIKNRLVAATQDGILQYNEAIDQFEPWPFLDSLMPFKEIRLMKEDPYGNIWVIYEKNIAVIDFSSDKPTTALIPELTNNLLSGFENIVFINEANTILGGEKGFYLLNYPKYKQIHLKITPIIRFVKVFGPSVQVLYEGYSNNPSDILGQIKPQWDAVHFDFSAPGFGQQEVIEYSVQLKGFDKNWSVWSNRTEKEYTNLAPGTYTFMVRARDNRGHISEAATYNFTILPPWYRTIWAYGFYLLAFAGVLYGWHRLQQQKIARQRKKYETEQERLKYLQQLEMEKSEKEIVKLRNEKLEAELELQQAELAAATMHLVQKAEIINDVKEEMLRLTKHYKAEISIPELKKMIKTLGEDEQVEQDWNQFAQHFDKVHSNFLLNLKEKFPLLTQSEMKLCAYLRMNLSSKEISQMMHITPKSVELSRYRLRKKLGLQHDENLYDFLIAATR